MSLMRVSAIRLFRPIAAVCQVQRGYSNDHGVMGSGSGKGGGTGGSIRDAGGAFGKMEAAHEEQYFRQLQAEQLKALKKHHDEEIEAHEREINRHAEEIKRLKKRRREIDSHTGSSSDSD
ncbi:ATPase inhibitor A, mitochondrial-like [Acanthaster planci]|uniref:ATP synthase F1 subunit epsilon n=1 Tax=Acanthaster planci TaxID=133434 RepID=A0A8B7XTW8_ACAPL|nr:ATPase inhibitor A, mitochondrial-like [Acanthaster planci]XP_022083450.1 ATPase inhibitor A, mitochondrial-like [Acanthaster planci]